jgi:hypothetical protein
MKYSRRILISQKKKDDLEYLDGERDIISLKINCVDWIHLSQDRYQRETVVNMIMTLS